MRRNIWLVATYAVLGPLVGVATLLLLTVALAPGNYATALPKLAENWPFMLSLGYGAGILPALASALLQIITERRLRTRGLRLAIAPLIGGLTSLAGLTAYNFSTRFLHADWWSVGMAIATGAAAALACLLLVECLHKQPDPA